ncbi:MAG: hypothetical protein JWN17_2317 [Frankiales bacterium]|nr:hypothetical protein [Frankiales bacterium]
MTSPRRDGSARDHATASRVRSRATLTSVPSPSGRREVIEQSWRRCEQGGLSPDQDLSMARLREIDRSSRLLTAAAPVLTDLAEHLSGTGYALLLADASSRLVDVRCGSSTLRHAVENAGAVLGQTFSEHVTGTNSLSTVYETRRGLAVHGDEHYLEALRGYSCYGQPIFHPATRRLEGVLDITCATSSANSLLGPFLARAASEIAERVLGTGREAQARMLSAFQLETLRRPGAPVLVLGEGVHLETPVVAALLDADDRALIADLALELRGTQDLSRTLVLSRGTSVRLDLARLPGGGSGVLCTLDVLEDAVRVVVPPAEAPASDVAPTPVPAAASFTLPRQPDGRVPAPDVDLSEACRLRTWTAVCGEPGTGRTTVAGRLAGDAPVHALHGGDAERLGRGPWLELLEQRLADAAVSGGLVLLEGVHVLTPALLHATEARILDAPVWLAVTSGPSDLATSEVRALLSRFPQRVDLPPLRSYRERLPELLRLMVLAEGGSEVRLAPTAQSVLTSLFWPGNLRELRQVARALAATAHGRSVGSEHLPQGYRSPDRTARLTPLEQAEHDTIRAALAAHAGNKVRTAAYLGISRTTLYKSMRTLGIPG